MIGQTTSEKIVHYKSTPAKDNFYNVLRKRVYQYFKDEGISPSGNTEMYLKSVLALGAWAGTYTLIMSNILSPYPLALLAAFSFLGFCSIFISFVIAHDCVHDAYHPKKWVNELMGYSFNFVGGNQYLLRNMHGAHHAFVNIHGIDVTLETHGMFRFTPHEPHKPIHRWQHIYIPFLYAMAQIHWVTVKDFKWFFVESHIGNSKNIKHPVKEWIALFLGKIAFWGTTLVLPLVYLDVSWWFVLICWCSIHILSGLTFALIFQVTHVYDGTYYPLPDDEGNIENNYALHTLETTADFCRKSRIGSFLMGSINIHVIHHIFPEICHVHYQKITPIVIKTAEEFGIKYKEYDTFSAAFKTHMKMLKHLSHPNAEVPMYSGQVPVPPVAAAPQQPLDVAS